MADHKIAGLGFHHVGLKASDYDRSRAFYTALGMKEVLSWGEGERAISLYDIGDGGKIEIFANGGEEYASNGKWIHFAFKVDDVDAAYTNALAAGATVMTPPKTVELASRPYLATIRVAFVYGPDGEQIELFRELEDKRG